VLERRLPAGTPSPATVPGPPTYYPPEVETPTNPTFAWVFLSLVWGSTWLFIKLGLEDLPPFSFAGIRFVIALVPLGLVLALRRQRLPRCRRDWAMVALTGVLLFTVDYGLIFWGERHLTCGLTAVLFSTTPLFGLLFAHRLVPDERLTPRMLLGVVVGIGGVVVIYAHQLHQEDPLAPIASLAITAAAASAALSNTLVKAHLTHLEPLVVTAGQMTVGVVPLLALGLATEGNPAAFDWTPLALASLVYLALVGSTLSFLLFYRLVRSVAVTRVQLLILVNTLVAVLLGWIVLGETLGVRGLVGTAAVLGGLGICFWAPRRAPRGARLAPAQGCPELRLAPPSPVPELAPGCRLDPGGHPSGSTCQPSRRG